MKTLNLQNVNYKKEPCFLLFCFVFSSSSSRFWNDLIRVCRVSKSSRTWSWRENTKITKNSELQGFHLTAQHDSIFLWLWGDVVIFIMSAVTAVSLWSPTSVLLLLATGFIFTWQGQGMLLQSAGIHMQPQLSFPLLGWTRLNRGDQWSQGNVFAGHMLYCNV